MAIFYGVVCMIFLLHVGGVIVSGFITANNMKDLARYTFASAQVFQNSVAVFTPTDKQNALRHDCNGK